MADVEIPPSVEEQKKTTTDPPREIAREPRRPRVKRERVDPRKDAEEEALRVRWVEEPQFAASDPTFAEIFVNLGHRDGVERIRLSAGAHRARPAFLAQKRVGFAFATVSSFVSVKREPLDKAVAR